MKPSELIKLAITDLEKCEADPDYTIDMSWWVYKTKDVCYVCLAGAVMVQTLKVYTHCGEETLPSGEWDCRLSALNHFREGRVAAGFELLGLGKPPIKDCNIISYRFDPARFKQDILTLAGRLEEYGC